MSSEPNSDQDLEVLQAELAVAAQKQSASLTATLTSAVLGSGLLVAALINLPATCPTPDSGTNTSATCVPSGWNGLYALAPLLGVLVAIVVLLNVNRLSVLGIYLTDLERAVIELTNTKFSVTGESGTKIERPAPSSEILVGALFTSRTKNIGSTQLQLILLVICIGVLVTSIVLPLSRLDNLIVQVIASLVYIVIFIYIVRFTYFSLGQTRRTAQTLWTEGLRSTATSAHRHSSDSKKESAKFFRFLIYPRPLSQIVAKPAITFSAILFGIVVSGGWSWPKFLTGLVCFIAIEFVFYAIRYQINDVRDREHDAKHPQKNMRDRLGFSVTRQRENVLLASFIVRVGTVFTFAAFALGPKAAVLVIGVPAMAILLHSVYYERQKTIERATAVYNTVPSRFRHHERNVLATIPFGYVIRFGLVALAAAFWQTSQPLFEWGGAWITTGWRDAWLPVGAARDTLAAIILATSIIALLELMLTANQWAVEAGAFVRNQKMAGTAPKNGDAHSTPPTREITNTIFARKELLKSSHLLMCLIRSGFAKPGDAIISDDTFSNEDSAYDYCPRVAILREDRRIRWFAIELGVAAATATLMAIIVSTLDISAVWTLIYSAATLIILTSIGYIFDRRLFGKRVYDLNERTVASAKHKILLFAAMSIAGLVAVALVAEISLYGATMTFLLPFLVYYMACFSLSLSYKDQVAESEKMVERIQRLKRWFAQLPTASRRMLFGSDQAI